MAPVWAADNIQKTREARTIRNEGKAVRKTLARFLTNFSDIVALAWCGGIRIGFIGSCNLPGESIKNKKKTITPLIADMAARVTIFLQEKLLHFRSKDDRGMASSDPTLEAIDAILSPLSNLPSEGPELLPLDTSLMP